MSDQPLPPASGGGRNHAGKFERGNTFGKGNPQLKRMHALRRAALDAIDDGTIQAVIRKMAVAAIRDGDVSAARLVLEYTIGKPVQAVALTDPVGEPLGASLADVEDAVLQALKPHGASAQFTVAAVLRGLVNHDNDPE